ncbi:hypothetical protein FB451DRAFT_1194456 [Mycena latifolia]|nr:hypothetical protein FB451DRAFT_1194456 [Mycena latifolia]
MSPRNTTVSDVLTRAHAVLGVRAVLLAPSVVGAERLKEARFQSISQHSSEEAVTARITRNPKVKNTAPAARIGTAKKVQVSTLERALNPRSRELVPRTEKRTETKSTKTLQRGIRYKFELSFVLFLFPYFIDHQVNSLLTDWRSMWCLAPEAAREGGDAQASESMVFS